MSRMPAKKNKKDDELEEPTDDPVVGAVDLGDDAEEEDGSEWKDGKEDSEDEY